MRCKYGFYTCDFIGISELCNTCEGGHNYQMKQKQTWGGKREGAGRPAKEPTKTLSYRVPERLAASIDKTIRIVIAGRLQNKKDNQTN